MANFKEETLRILAKNGKSWDDVEFIQGHYFRVPDKNLFLELMNQTYDSGYGGTRIPTDLVIVGKGWWLERHEYDGAEWWEYKECPKPLPIIEVVKEFIMGKEGLHNSCNIKKKEYTNNYLWED